MPEALVRREVRYGLGTAGVQTRQITLGTTLLNPAISWVPDLAALYLQRWQVETSLAQLKPTRQMDVLHGQPVSGVLQELTIFALVSHLVRLVMWPSATRQHTAVERISFLAALRWLSAPQTGMPLVALIVIPIRPHRVEPHVTKRRPKSVPFMITPRQTLRQQLLQPELSS